MDDLSLIQWYNNHHQEQQSLDLDSETMFLNPLINQFPPTIWTDDSAMAASHNLASNNGFQESKNVISISTTATSLESLDRLLSGNNSNADVASDGISVIFSDRKRLFPNNNVIAGNNDISGLSSGDSVTKEIDDGAVSQCSSGKRPISGGTGVLEDDNNPRKPKRSRSNTGRPTSSNINFQQPGNPSETDVEAIAQMKEMIYREAAFRPVSFTAETVVEKPKRKNVRISSDPQTVAARQRRERVSERIRVLQKLVPGGNKMDTASMLDEAANYLKFLRSQVKALEQMNGTTINANGTNPIITNKNHVAASMVVPFGHNPFSMQTHFHQFSHENMYPNNQSS